MNEGCGGDEREARLHEALLAYVEAAEEGRAPERERFLAGHPDLRAELEEFLLTRDEVERLARPARAALEPPSGRGKLVGGAAEVGLPAGIGRLGDFVLLREAGRGGMGVVYEAEQISLRRRVALKVLPFAAALDPRQLQRFHNEALAAAHLRHEHIVPVIAVGNERGVHYYAMQFIEGNSLAALIADLRQRGTGGAKTVDEGETRPAQTAGDQAGLATLSRERSGGGRKYFSRVADLGRQAALALEHAHQTGVVHRDVKPANLLLDPRGQLWVTDFGLAQVRGNGSLTRTGEMLGTLRYASPEQALARPGLVDPRTDVYSLGATLYELLTLRPIFDGRDHRELLRQIADEEPVAPRAVDRTIPAELETIVLKAVAKEPGDRYASARELADDLQRFLDDRPVRARRPSAAERAARWARRHRSVVATALAALLLSVLGLSVATALTARAYDRERAKAAEADEQRARAEESSRQAREAVKLFEQIGEEELAGNPGQRRLRQRLLAAALVYYQNFIEQRRDDPSIRAELEASRARVKTILDELVTLMGSGKYLYLSWKEVQEELRLTAEQRQAMTGMDEKWREWFGGAWGRDAEEWERRHLALAREQEVRVASLLEPWQLARFKQIALQYQGPAAFTDPEVALALGLDADQKKRIRKILERPIPPPWWPGTGGKGDRGPPPPPPEAWDDARKRSRDEILAVLTPGQARQWEEMLGKPFKGRPLPAFPFAHPFPAPGKP